MLDDLTAVSAADLAAAWRDLYIWQHEGWTAPPLSIAALAPVLAAEVAATDRQLSTGAWVEAGSPRSPPPSSTAKAA